MSFQRIIAIFLLLACIAAYADKRRDPLTSDEVSKVRDTSDQPDKRILLYVEFAKARLMAIEQLRADTKLKTDRGKQIHDLLEDFTTIIDELDSNIDMYDRQHQDLRKSLKGVVEAYTDWQLKLRSLKEAAAVSDVEKRTYDFPLDSAIDSVNSELDSARETLEKQNKNAQELKKKK
jgi:chromosome segregation ATPase